MTTDTSTITAFLLARIAEDEAVAQAATVSPSYHGSFGETAAEEIVNLALSEGAERAGADHFENWMPARVLAQCAAYRAIVERHTGTMWVVEMCDECRDQTRPCPTLRTLVAIWADHPDFDSAWSL